MDIAAYRFTEDQRGQGGDSGGPLVTTHTRDADLNESSSDGLVGLLTGNCEPGAEAAIVPSTLDGEGWKLDLELL